MKFLPGVNVEDGRVQDLCREELFPHTYKQLYTYRITAKLLVWRGRWADGPDVPRLSAVPPGFTLHQSPDCSGPTEQRTLFFTVCCSVAGEEGTKTREVVSNRAGNEGLIIYHRDVSLIWLVCLFFLYF